MFQGSGSGCLRVETERVQSCKEFAEVEHDARRLETGFHES